MWNTLKRWLQARGADAANVAAAPDVAAARVAEPAGNIVEPAPIPASATAPAEAAPAPTAEELYQARMATEIAIFAEQIDVHVLPEIFHYWSNTYLRVLMEQFGYSYPEDFFAKEIARARAARGRPIRVISIGAGNGDTEVRVAQLLRDRGVSGVRIECMDINPSMLLRCTEHAAAAGLADVVTPVAGDFNRWQPDGNYDVVMANQSLHHVLELETLFDAIRETIGAEGVFLTCDMIGRNGHRRWPEALVELQRFWQELPEAKRYNLQLKRLEPEFMDWDCSVEGFEGVRAQDILPLLVQRFGFDTFIAWGNVLDIFIDRSFGHHLDAKDPTDRDFVDRIHARDEQGLLAGEWKPTHLMAVMTRDQRGATRQWKHLSPAFCVRQP